VSDELNVAEQLFKGYLSGREDIVGCFDHLSEGGNFLLEDAAKRLLLMLVDVALIVGIDFLSPKLLESELFLHLILEDSKLRREAEGGEDGLLFLEGDGLGRSFDGLRGLLDAVGSVQRVLRFRLFARVVLFTLPNFQRHIKLLRRPHQLPLL
jgi:hypothetical protein